MYRITSQILCYIVPDRISMHFLVDNYQETVPFTTEN